MLLKRKEKTIEEKVFTKQMSINSIVMTKGIIEIPSGYTTMEDEFAMVFDWCEEDYFMHPFRELVIPETIRIMPPIWVTASSPEESHAEIFKTITVHPDNPYYCSEDGVLFTKDKKTLVCYPCGKEGESYTIPEGVTNIGEAAFVNNVYLKKVVIPQSVIRIEKQAFFQMQTIREIHVPETVTYIGEECFDLCVSLNRIELPEHLEVLYSSIFSSGVAVLVPDHVDNIRTDYIRTTWQKVPYMNPMILTKNNPKVTAFAEENEYAHYEGVYTGPDGIIWSGDKKTLLCFPATWENDTYELPKEAREIYRYAFYKSDIKSVTSEEKVTLVGEAWPARRNEVTVKGTRFKVTDKGFLKKEA